MKISEVMKNLEKLQEELGDIEIYSEGDGCLEEPSFDVMTFDVGLKLRVPSKGCKCMSCNDFLEVTMPWIEVW